MVSRTNDIRATGSQPRHQGGGHQNRHGKPSAENVGRLYKARIQRPGVVQGTAQPDG